MPEPPRRFVFSFRFTGSDTIASPREEREELERLDLLNIESRLPRTSDSLDVQSRRLEPAELAEHLDRVPLVEAEFLGPVCAGLEVTLRCDDPLVDIDRRVMAALTSAAWACGGPVVRAADREVRYPIDLVTFPAEALATPGCFGADILLALPDCEAYEAHVQAAVRTTLAQAGVDVDYFYSTGEDHVKLCFSAHPNQPHAGFWRSLFAPGPSTAERLRGHEFRAIAYVKQLADDAPFWRSLAPGS